MLVRRPHFTRSRADIALVRTEIARSWQSRLRPAQLPIGAGLDECKHVLDVHHAQRIIQSFAINRKPRMLRVAEQRHETGERHLLLDRNDIGARNHDIGNQQLAEFEQVAEHQTFLRAQLLGLALAFLDHLFQALANLRVPAQALYAWARRAAISLSSERGLG
jgi:hypothetical protein